jgi:predicted DNA-binding ribbon-helix-helix protein
LADCGEHSAGRPRKKSPIIKRWAKVANRPTSFRLEDAFWSALKEIAATNVSVSDLITIIDKERQHSNLSSAIRVFILDYYRS